MAVVSKPTLKSYFEDGKEPDENKYIDLIDTMGVGDMLKSVYDTNDDGKVNSAVNADAVPWTGVSGKPATYPATTPVADSSKLGNVAAAEYLQRLSASRPGVDRIYRRDSDNGYNLQTAWDGTYWELKGYNGDTYHAPVQVGDSDTVDGYHASDLYRDNANFATSGYLDTSSYVDAALSYKVAGVQGGIVRLFDNFLSYGAWDGGTAIGAGGRTLTRANFGYSANARGLYGRIMGNATSSAGYMGINTNLSLYDWPIAISYPVGSWESMYGWWWLTSKGGNFYVRNSSTAYMVIQIWGEIF
jgi:hypothetical protein